jgi:hypothetical protein
MKTWARYKTFGGVCVYELRNAENTRAAVVRNFGTDKELATYKRAESRGEWTRVNAVYYDTVKEAKANGAEFVGA